MSFPRSSLSEFSMTLSARPLWVGGLLSAFLLAGCGQGSKGADAGAKPPLAQVGVVTVALSDIGLTTELPGRLEASRVAQVRARATGILQKRLFREGSDVKAGEALFTIDSAPYAAAYASAQASLARAQANLEQATSLAQRYQPLVKANAVSKQEFANAEAAQKQAEADVAVGKAAVQTAKITLDYAAVTAPISGRIGRALVTEGALVGQGEFTQLAVIQQINPMYINFTQPAAEVMKLRKALEAGQLKRASGDEAVRVRLVLEDGSVYAQSGRLLFSDLSVDQATGQITLRAEVPNAKGLLLPGLYVRVRLEQAQAANAMLLPQQAVTRSDQGDTVMVVAADGMVAQRKVKVGVSQGSQWVILEGLQAGEQVMVDGFQKLRGPAPVKPVPWTGNADSAAPAKADSAIATPSAPASAAKK
ncbi:MAG: efflux RND transporter periplasmic adaptor subunit [Polaromonas sp.]|nr:efflux RND transporter periplasmic adaptor subunit [Polaromonas sp.]